MTEKDIEDAKNAIQRLSCYISPDGHHPRDSDIRTLQKIFGVRDNKISTLISGNS